MLRTKLLGIWAILRGRNLGLPLPQGGGSPAPRPVAVVVPRHQMSHSHDILCFDDEKVTNAGFYQHLNTCHKSLFVESDHDKNVDSPRSCVCCFSRSVGPQLPEPEPYCPQPESTHSSWREKEMICLYCLFSVQESVLFNLKWIGSSPDF